MQLFHVSEDPNIKEFIPLPAPNPDAGLEGSAVWAINEAELPNYLLPRNCPRVCYRKADNTKVIAVEEAWIEKIKNTQLFLYVFDSTPFSEWDQTAGYWISRGAVIPQSVIPIKDCLSELKQRGVELKFLPHLHDERDSVIKNYKHFSIIRFKFAKFPNSI